MPTNPAVLIHTRCTLIHALYAAHFLCLCRQWVPVRLDAADNLQQGLAGCLHADGSCGPLGFKQRVMLDLQCRGFALQIR